MQNFWPFLATISGDRRRLQCRRDTRSSRNATRQLRSASLISTAAFRAYVKHYPERIILLRQGGQVIRRSDRSY
jgi:hypothetical protein